MTVPKNHVLILLLISCSFLARAQGDNNIENQKKELAKFPLTVAIGNQAVGFPFQNSFIAFNPNISIGTELGINKNQKHHLFASSTMGFIANEVIGNTLTLDLGIGYRFTHMAGGFIDFGLNLGLLDQFHPRDIYVQNQADGSYDRINDNGTFSSYIGFKSGIGYDFLQKHNRPFRIGINHHFFIQTVYFDVANFPIMPQSTTNISFTYKFLKK